MLGFIFSIIAGAAMSLQGVMNTRLSEKVGLFESNLYVQGMAFMLSAAAFMIMGGMTSSDSAQSGFTQLKHENCDRYR